MDTYQKSLFCPKCSLQFRTGYILRFHMKLVHKKESDNEALEKDSNSENESFESSSEHNSSNTEQTMKVKTFRNIPFCSIFTAFLHNFHETRKQ